MILILLVPLLKIIKILKVIILCFLPAQVGEGAAAMKRELRPRWHVRRAEEVPLPTAGRLPGDSRMSPAVAQQLGREHSGTRTAAQVPSRGPQGLPAAPRHGLLLPAGGLRLGRAAQDRPKGGYLLCVHSDGEGLW